MNARNSLIGARLGACRSFLGNPNNTQRIGGGLEEATASDDERESRYSHEIVLFEKIWIISV
jgi:hypothetical protein